MEMQAVKPFDVDLSWMSKFRNQQRAAFWTAESLEGTYHFFPTPSTTLLGNTSLTLSFPRTARAGQSRPQRRQHPRFLLQKAEIAHPLRPPARPHPHLHRIAVLLLFHQPLDPHPYSSNHSTLPRRGIRPRTLRHRHTALHLFTPPAQDHESQIPDRNLWRVSDGDG